MTTMTLATPVTNPATQMAEIMFDCGPTPPDQMIIDSITAPYVCGVSIRAPREGKEGSYILTVRVDVKLWADIAEVVLPADKDGHAILDRQTMLRISACISGRPYRKPDTYQAELAGRPDHQVVMSEEPNDGLEFDPELD